MIRLFLQQSVLNIFVGLPIYFVWAFVLMELDPREWTIGVRTLFVCVWLIALPAKEFLKQKKEEEE